MSLYKATIYFDAYEDDFKEGEAMNCDNQWTETLMAKTKAELREKIANATYCDWAKGEIERGDDSDVEAAIEYWAGYTANAENEGEASAAEIEQWKQGKCRLWAIHCQILVSKVTQTKAVI